MTGVDAILSELPQEHPAGHPGPPAPRDLRRALVLLLRAALGDARGRRALPPDPTRAALLIDRLVHQLDRRLAASVDAILHHPAVQGLEAGWRSLRRLLDRLDPTENITVALLPCTKEELAEDFVSAPEITRSGLYLQVYSQAFGIFGGRPYGLLCATFDLGPGAEDLGLLRDCAAVAAIAHAPLIANASPTLLGLENFTELPRLDDPAAALAGPRHRLWHALRATEDARYVGLCLPRVLLRRPYDVDAEPTLGLRYRETIRCPSDMLWGPASVEFAAIAGAAFARHRWCVDLLGSRAAGDHHQLLLPTPTLGELWPQLPVECQLTARLERSLADEGLIPLVWERPSARALLLSAPSIRAPAILGAGTASAREAALSERLGAQLPYIFLICRLAHYLKCVQRERVGSWLDRSALERELSLWLRRYIADQEDAQREVRARRPFRRASVRVEAVAGQAGWYRCHLELQPHLTHNAASFTLSLVGKLDRPQGSQGSQGSQGPQGPQGPGATPS